jgi:hypothetical protein
MPRISTPIFVASVMIASLPMAALLITAVVALIYGRLVFAACSTLVDSVHRQHTRQTEGR